MDMPSAHEGEDAQQPTTNIRVRREEAGDLSQFEEKKKKNLLQWSQFWLIVTVLERKEEF